MTVEQLITLLNNVKDKSQMVVVNGYEGGYSEVNSIIHTTLVIDVHSEWYYGPHDEPQALCEDEEIGKDVVDAIRISCIKGDK